MKFLNTILFFAIVAVFVSCAPTSKEKYMAQFDAFITQVSQECDTYTEKDWQKMEQKYNKFTTEWYYKFEPELTLKEEVRIKAWQLKWNAIYSIDAFGDFVNRWDVEAQKAKIQYYIENDMEEDLRKLQKEAEEAGKEAQKQLKELYDELKVEEKFDL